MCDSQNLSTSQHEFTTLLLSFCDSRVKLLKKYSYICVPYHDMIDFSYYFRLMNDKLDYIAIDFETANQYKNSACSIGLIRFINGKETDSCYSLIHPAKMYFIPECVRDIHHISYNHVRDTKNQIVLIAGIKGLLQQYKGTPLFNNIEKLFYLFEPKIAKSSGLISSARIAVPPQMEFNINLNNWEKILKPMEQNKKIKSRYTAPYKNSELQITLWPNKHRSLLWQKRKEHHTK